MMNDGESFLWEKVKKNGPLVCQHARLPAWVAYQRLVLAGLKS